MTWTPRPPPGFLHIGRWSRLLGDYECVMCHAMFFMLAEYGCDHGGDCPGWIAPVPPDATLPGTPPLSPNSRGYWEARAPRVSQR